MISARLELYGLSMSNSNYTRYFRNRREIEHHIGLPCLAVSSRFGDQRSRSTIKGRAGLFRPVVEGVLLAAVFAKRGLGSSLDRNARR